MKTLRTVIAGVGLCLTLAQVTAADFVVLNPLKDNTLIQTVAGETELSNGQGDIFVGRTNQDGQGPAIHSTRRGLIEFDVATAIPAGSTITDVTLTMWDVRGLNGARTIDLHRALADWGEGASFFNGGVGGPAEPGDATWTSRFFDSSGGPKWATPGGDFDSVVSGSAVVTEHPSDVSKAFSWLGSANAQMIADVQTWLDNPSTNFGWLLQGDESQGQTAKRFQSGEATDPSFRPTLTVTFSPRSVPEPASLAMLGVGAALTLYACRHRRTKDGPK